MPTATPFAVTVTAAAALFTSTLPSQEAGDRAGATISAESARFDFDAEWRKIADELHGLCEQQGVVGGSLWFIDGSRVRAFECHGFADQAGERAVDGETVFHWASITKTLTGIAVMQLRDRGRLQLEQPVIDFVPELAEVHNPHGPTEGILIRHVMSHSAGFRGSTWPWGGNEDWHPHEPTRWSQLVAMMPYTEVEFAPGSRFSYSNPGIIFLGRAIERLSGDDYEVYMHKNVLGPLGMTSSYFDVTPYHLQKHRSHSYSRGRDGAVQDLGPDFDTGITVSNGGLNAPVSDMARYLMFLLGAREAGTPAAAVLARDSLESMWQPIVPVALAGDAGGEQMGLTFFLQQHGGQRFVTHTGGQRSFITFFYVHPESGTGALGAFNTGTAGPVMAALRRACMQRLSLPLAAERR